MGCKRIINSSCELKRYLLFLLLILILFSINVYAKEEQKQQEQVTPLQFLPYNFDVNNVNIGFSNNVQLQNDLFSGGFSIYYPFEVPQGINNFQPNVFLMYNSHAIQNKQGVIDAGWSFSESYIQRDTNQVGYFNSKTRTFISTVGNKIITVIGKTNNKYMSRLRSKPWR